MNLLDQCGNVLVEFFSDLGTGFLMLLGLLLIIGLLSLLDRRD